MVSQVNQFDLALFILFIESYAALDFIHYIPSVSFEYFVNFSFETDPLQSKIVLFFLFEIVCYVLFQFLFDLG